jgi:hypothetical protein
VQKVKGFASCKCEAGECNNGFQVFKERRHQALANGVRVNIPDRAAIFNENLATNDKLDCHGKSLRHHTTKQALFVALV